MLPRKKHHLSHHNDEAGPSTMHEERADIDDDHLWCKGNDNKWTRLLGEGLKDKNPGKLYDALIRLARCAEKETIVTKQKFLKYAAEGMANSNIENNLKDYRDCILPLYLSITYDNMRGYEEPYAIGYAFRCLQAYYDAFQQTMKNGCPYHPELLNDIKPVEFFCQTMICFLYRTMKFFEETPETNKTISLPDYLTSNTGNTIRFFLDYLLIRDFHKFCKRIAMIFVFQRRSLYLKTQAAVMKCD